MVAPSLTTPASAVRGLEANPLLSLPAKHLCFSGCSLPKKETVCFVCFERTKCKTGNVQFKPIKDHQNGLTSKMFFFPFRLVSE